MSLNLLRIPVEKIFFGLTAVLSFFHLLINLIQRLTFQCNETFQKRTSLFLTYPGYIYLYDLKHQIGFVFFNSPHTPSFHYFSSLFSVCRVSLQSTNVFWHGIFTVIKTSNKKKPTSFPAQLLEEIDQASLLLAGAFLLILRDS